MLSTVARHIQLLLVANSQTRLLALSANGGTRKGGRYQANGEGHYDHENSFGGYSWRCFLRLPVEEVDQLHRPSTHARSRLPFLLAYHCGSTWISAFVIYTMQEKELPASCTKSVESCSL